MKKELLSDNMLYELLLQKKCAHIIYLKHNAYYSAIHVDIKCICDIDI